MNKYKELFSNTLLFAISNFGSKILIFLLMPLYTNVLSTAEYGTADIIMNTISLIYPLLTLSISESCMRFALDRVSNKKQIFTNALRISLIGIIFFIISTPLIIKMGIPKEFVILALLIHSFTAIHTIMIQFLRGIGEIKLFAIDGIVSSIILVIFNFIFLLKLEMGINGYLLAFLMSKIIPVNILFIKGKLYKYVDFKNKDKYLLKEMLNYSWPLIPNTLSWWVTNVSDRYIVIAYCGVAINGLYSAAYKIPTILSLVVNIFMQAWQLSATKGYDTEDKDEFYSIMYRYFTSVIFICGSGLIIFTKPLSQLFFAKDFYTAWIYVPFLIIAVVFNSSVSFLGSVYLATKKTKTVFITSTIGSGINIILNFIFIPNIGAIGAAIATMVSYLIVWICRTVDTYKYVKIRTNYIRIILMTIVILTQSMFIMMEMKNYIFINIILFIVMLLINFKELKSVWEIANTVVLKLFMKRLKG